MEILYWKNRIYVDTKKEQDELWNIFPKSVKSVASYFTYFYCANYGIYANMEALEVIFSE